MEWTKLEILASWMFPQYAESNLNPKKFFEQLPESEKSDVRKALHEILEAPNERQEWHKVENKLPAPGDHVLGCDVEGDLIEVVFDRKGGFLRWDDSDEEWEPPADVITHWREYPPKPKEYQ